MKDNKKLYESVMVSVAKVVKKALNEYGSYGGFEKEGGTFYAEKNYRETESYKNIEKELQLKKFDNLYEIVQSCINANDGIGIYAALGYIFDILQKMKIEYKVPEKASEALKLGFVCIFQAEKNKMKFKKLFEIDPDKNPEEVEMTKKKISELYKAITSKYIGIFGK